MRCNSQFNVLVAKTRHFSADDYLIVCFADLYRQGMQQLGFGLAPIFQVVPILTPAAFIQLVSTAGYAFVSLMHKLRKWGTRT